MESPEECKGNVVCFLLKSIKTFVFFVLSTLSTGFESIDFASKTVFCFRLDFLGI